MKIKNKPELEISHVDKLLTKEGVEIIKERYPGSKYVGEFCPINKLGDFVNQPLAVFWTPEAHPQGSNYFGIYYDYVHGRSMITNGLSAISQEIVGIKIPDTNKVVYSAYRHDFQELGEVFIDGGRDYVRIGGLPETVKLAIVDGEWEIKDN